jgi:hypothetical protein
MNQSHARRAVELLATLRPSLIAAGHGLTMNFPRVSWRDWRRARAWLDGELTRKPDADRHS